MAKLTVKASKASKALSIVTTDESAQIVASVQAVEIAWQRKTAHKTRQAWEDVQGVALNSFNAWTTSVNFAACLRFADFLKTHGGKDEVSKLVGKDGSLVTFGISEQAFQQCGKSMVVDGMEVFRHSQGGLIAADCLQGFYSRAVSSELESFAGCDKWEAFKVKTRKGLDNGEYGAEYVALIETLNADKSRMVHFAGIGAQRKLCWNRACLRVANEEKALLTVICGKASNEEREKLIAGMVAKVAEVKAKAIKGKKSVAAIEG